ncbi:MAG: DUF4367 domain-containing protein [Oscillospiraceae bacterium]|jgi:hypothetical protein|nr:DUF4367 domain-containing protein [Oscillospiraceae bacterium]
MNFPYSAAELEEKPVEELQALLTDDTLLPLDDATNTAKILEIMDVIKRKENKPAAQRETERVAFWTGLLARHGDKLPFLLEHVADPLAEDARQDNPNPKRTRTRFHRRFPRHKWVRRCAIAATLATALLLTNTLVAYAFRLDILRVIASFTDDLFRMSIVSTEETTPAPVPSPQSDHDAFQAALDDMGITHPKAPGWLPDGFVFNFLQVADMRNSKIVAAQYKRGEENIILTVTLFSRLPPEFTRIHEKSPGDPLEYEYNGITHYIFNNLDRTVATWFYDMRDCDIQGHVSVEEIKAIINSMYEEDLP